MWPFLTLHCMVNIPCVEHLSGELFWTWSLDSGKMVEKKYAEQYLKWLFHIYPIVESVCQPRIFGGCWKTLRDTATPGFAFNRPWNPKLTSIMGLPQVFRTLLVFLVLASEGLFLKEVPTGCISAIFRKDGKFRSFNWPSTTMSRSFFWEVTSQNYHFHDLLLRTVQFFTCFTCSLDHW